MSVSGGKGEDGEALAADPAIPWMPVEPTCCFSMDGGGAVVTPSLGELGWAGGAITIEVVVRWAGSPRHVSGHASSDTAESLWCRQVDAGPQGVVEAEPFLVGESDLQRARSDSVGRGPAVAIAADDENVVASIGEQGSGLIRGPMPAADADCWRHVCLAAGDGALALCVDGALIGSDQAAPIRRSTRIRVGGLGFRGDLLLLRLWSASLPAAACARLAAHPLIALHPLERLAGQAAQVFAAVGPGLIACAAGSVALLGHVALRPLTPGGLPASWSRSVHVEEPDAGPDQASSSTFCSAAALSASR